MSPTWIQAPRRQIIKPLPGKVSVNLPTDEWLSNKLSKLNLTLVQGYPSRTTEAGALQRDQFVRTAKSQSKWYGVHSESKKDSISTANLGTLVLPALIVPI